MKERIMECKSHTLASGSVIGSVIAVFRNNNNAPMTRVDLKKKVPTFHASMVSGIRTDESDVVIWKNLYYGKWGPFLVQNVDKKVCLHTDYLNLVN